MHYVGPEMGEWVSALNFMEFAVVNAHGVFSVLQVHVSHDIDVKTVELSTKRMVQGRWGLAK